MRSTTGKRWWSLRGFYHIRRTNLYAIRIGVAEREAEFVRDLRMKTMPQYCRRIARRFDCTDASYARMLRAMRNLNR